MGLNTGPVVVGKIGENLRMDYTAVGDTTNLAARLQQHAEPGSILISESTRLGNIKAVPGSSPCGTGHNRDQPTAQHARADRARLTVPESGA
jgi:class 3 adenylate cyclase